MSVGREDIDSQHKRLLNIINRLGEEITANERYEIEKILNSLLKYTVYHFGYEEELFDGYPRTNAHKQEHTDFFEFMIKQQELWQSTGEIKLEDLRRYLNCWLNHHISVIDKEAFEWLEALEAEQNEMPDSASESKKAL